jgi:hypothetical protein
MILCKECEHPICDFCTHFRIHKKMHADYTGDGWCKLHQKEVDIAYVCEDFHCEFAEKDDE